MAIALVQSKKNINTGVDTQATSFDAQPAAGNLIVVAVGTYAGDLETTAVSDNQGNTYTRAAHLYYTDSGPFCVSIFYTVVAATGTPFTITIDPVGTGTYISACIAEFSGLAATSVLDQNNTASAASSDTTPSVSVTTTADGELYLGVVTWNSTNTTVTEGANYTLIQENETGGTNMGLSVEYRVTTQGTIAADWTLGAARKWFAAIASFKEATGIPRHAMYYARRNRT